MMHGMTVKRSPFLGGDEGSATRSISRSGAHLTRSPDSIGTIWPGGRRRYEASPTPVPGRFFESIAGRGNAVNSAAACLTLREVIEPFVLDCSFHFLRVTVGTASFWIQCPMKGRDLSRGGWQCCRNPVGDAGRRGRDRGRGRCAEENTQPDSWAVISVLRLLSLRGVLACPERSRMGRGNPRQCGTMSYLAS